MKSKITLEHGTALLREIRILAAEECTSIRANWTGLENPPALENI